VFVRRQPRLRHPRLDLQSALGNPPARAAPLFAPMAAALAIGSMLAPLPVRRLRPSGHGRAIAAGLLGAADGHVTTGAVVVALGTGPLLALGTGLVLAAVPRERAGAAVSSPDPALVATARTAYPEGMSVAGVLCGGLAFPVTRSFRETPSDAVQMARKPFSATNRPLGDR
jgi:hypothetical protein